MNKKDEKDKAKREEKEKGKKEKKEGDGEKKEKKARIAEPEEDDDRRLLVIFRPQKNQEALWAPVINWYSRGPVLEQGGTISEKQAPLPIVRKWKEERRRR